VAASPAEPARWILLIHTIAPRPHYLRVKIGRRLQKLGAVAVKNSVYALPRSDGAREDLEWVAHEISADGGEASVADEVAAGRADAGFGLRADATRYKLAFTPLATERYFFACAKAALRGAALKVLLDTLKSPEFSARASRLPGYDASQSGRREALDAALTWVERS